MKLKLYETVVLLHPHELESEKVHTEIICEKQSVLAKDDKTAGMIAVRSIPDRFMSDLDRCEVIVRPF